MARLSLHTLGAFQATLDEQPVTGFESHKVRALLIYLAVEAGRPHPREVLAGLLWPEQPDRAARSNLRYVLSNLRQAIGDRDAVPPYLLVTRDTLQFNTASDHWLDVAAFTELAGLEDPPALEQAVALYGGSFLEGFSVSGAAPFEEWALLRREQLGQQVFAVLRHLAATHERHGAYERGQACARRQVELEPWNEEAHQQLMRLLALGGQRSAALAQYEACRRLLAEELGVEPARETIALYESIRDGALVAPPFVSTPPSVTRTDAEPGEVERPLCVAREGELERLDALLGQALAGHGRVAFVVGEAGSGKTALTRAFIQRSMEMHADLVAADGRCNAHTGIGDPYLPFREILQMLGGDIEARWAAGTIGREHAHRLWALLGDTVRALVDCGPDLIDRFMPGTALVARAWAATPDQVPRLQDLMAHRAATAAGAAAVGQADLFAQYTRVLQALARDRPLVLAVDDLQWADAGSISLLFHLGRRLAGSRILLIGAYRPGDLEMGRSGARHPLQPVIHEFRREWGEIEVDLDRAEGRRFVDAVLDSEPNRLGMAFRDMLYRQTAGHPLFTVELLRGMQERGDLIRDEAGRWIEGTAVDWEALPARVEAVIAERIACLTAPSRRALRVASVEGEEFTAEAVARVRGVAEREMVTHLSRELDRRHRLVRAQDILRAGAGCLSRYRFRHILYQRYLYSQLDRIERAHLHGQVGSTLETLYGQHEEIADLAPQLAWHFEVAGDLAKATSYLRQSGERALRLSANEEAIAHCARGTALLERLPETPARDEQELGLQMTLATALGMARGHGDPGSGQAYARARELCRQRRDTAQLFRAVWGLWRFYLVRAELQRAGEVGEQLLDMARSAQDTVLLLEAHHALGTTLYSCGALSLARAHLEEGIALYDLEQHRLHTVLYGQDPGVSCLCYLSCILWLTGYPDHAVRRMEEALGLARDLTHPLTLAFAFGFAGKLYWLCRDEHAVQQQAQALLALSSEYGFPQWSAIGTIHLGWVLVEQGEVEKGIAEMRRGLEAYRAASVALTRPRFLVELAGACARAGRAEKGLKTLDEAQTLIEGSGEGYYTAELYRLRGELLLMGGRGEGGSTEHLRAAEACFQQAIESARGQGARSWELRAAVSMCKLWRSQGETVRAQDLLSEVYGRFTEGFDTPDLREAKALLDALA